MASNTRADAGTRLLDAGKAQAGWPRRTAFHSMMSSRSKGLGIMIVARPLFPLIAQLLKRIEWEAHLRGL